VIIDQFKERVMIISGVDSQTGKEIKTEVSALPAAFIKYMSDFNLSEKNIKASIDKLQISADAKSALYAFSRTTIKAGEFILKIGRKIVDFVLTLYEEFPTASFGMIFGGIVGLLISSIPIAGFVLGPVFAPIAISFGLVVGVSEDLKDKSLARKITEFNAGLTPLKA